jgi:hypothetical protein
VKVVITREGNHEEESLEIVIDDIKKFRVHNSNEDLEANTLSENFEDCYDIPALLRYAYEAGKRGDKFQLVYVEGEDEI